MRKKVRNNPVVRKVTEEYERRGREWMLQANRAKIPLQPMKDHGAEDIHAVAHGGPPVMADESALKEAATRRKDPHWNSGKV